MDRTQELEEQVRRLSLTVDEMHDRMGRLETAGATSEREGPRRSRGGFLRMGAAAAAGALGWAAVRVVPAAAATGGNMIVGCSNLAENPTILKADNVAGSPVLDIQDFNFSASSLATAQAVFGFEAFSAPLQAKGANASTEGVDAWAGGDTAYAIYGFTDQGTGVVGESLTGIGLYARTTGRIRQDPQGGVGLPSYTPNLMEQVRDSSGVLWIHNATGNWRRVNTLRTDAADGTGVAFKPFRLIDTRSGAIKAPGSVTSLQVTGAGSGVSSIPADAIAVVGNLTAAAYTGGGFLTISPDGTTINPTTDPSTVNFQVGQGAIANSFVCGLNPANGKLQVYVGGPPLPGHSSHFIVDITGYIQ